MWEADADDRNRMALWYVVNLVVSAFGNILAWAIVKLNGSYGIAGWRWIFM